MEKRLDKTPQVLCMYVVSQKQVTGDMVIGADGVRSKARELVLGYVDKPKSSGYAVFRAWSVIKNGQRLFPD